MDQNVTSHKVNGLNEILEITAYNPLGHGGAPFLYDVFWPSKDGNSRLYNPQSIKFQEGPIAEAGVNGLSNEALLAIVEHRLACFQAGPYSCRENAIALTKIQEAMHWLHHRTRERVARGVEGTSKV